MNQSEMKIVLFVNFTWIYLEHTFINFLNPFFIVYLNKVHQMKYNLFYSTQDTMCEVSRCYKSTSDQLQTKITEET